MPLITVEQAVEAVERVQVEHAGVLHRDDVIAALRAIKPKGQSAAERYTALDAQLTALLDAMDVAWDAMTAEDRQAARRVQVEPAEPSEAEVERVARAVWQWMPDDWSESLTASPQTWESVHECDREAMIAIARAAIAAMRKGG